MHVHNNRTDSNRGFTLVEILIVVVILGVLASVVFAGFRDAANQTRQGAFVTELHHYVTAAEYFIADTGIIIPDGSSGLVPPGFERYVDTTDWESATPLGGVWDTEGSDSGFVAALGVHFINGDNPGNEVMLEVDAILDDGDLSTGVFRQSSDSDRFYYALIF